MLRLVRDFSGNICKLSHFRSEAGIDVRFVSASGLKSPVYTGPVVYTTGILCAGLRPKLSAIERAPRSRVGLMRASYSVPP